MKRSRVALSLFMATFATSLLAAGFASDRSRVAAEPPAAKCVHAPATAEFGREYWGYEQYLYDRCEYAFGLMANVEHVAIEDSVEAIDDETPADETDYDASYEEVTENTYTDDLYNELDEGFGLDEYRAVEVQRPAHESPSQAAYPYGDDYEYGDGYQPKSSDDYSVFDEGIDYEYGLAPSTPAGAPPAPSAPATLVDNDRRYIPYDEYEDVECYGTGQIVPAPRVDSAPPPAPRDVIPPVASTPAPVEPWDDFDAEIANPPAAQIAQPTPTKNWSPADMGPCTRQQQRWAYDYDDGAYWANDFNVIPPGADSLVEILRNKRYNAGAIDANRINADNDGVEASDLDQWTDETIEAAKIETNQKVTIDETPHNEFIDDEFGLEWIEVSPRREVIVVEIYPIPDSSDVQSDPALPTLQAAIDIVQQFRVQAAQLVADRLVAQWHRVRSNFVGSEPKDLASSLRDGYHQAARWISRDLGQLVEHAVSGMDLPTARKAPVESPRTTRRSIDDAFEL